MRWNFTSMVTSVGNWPFHSTWLAEKRYFFTASIAFPIHLSPCRIVVEVGQLNPRNERMTVTFLGTAFPRQ